MNTPWRNLKDKHNLNFQIPEKFLSTCPKDYIEEILNEKKTKKEKELIPISPQELKNIFELEINGINEEKEKENFDKNSLLNNNYILLDKSDNSSLLSGDLDINTGSNRNNGINLDEIEEAKNENSIKFETEIKNRIDNLFDRLKSMFNQYFIKIFNTKVEKENKLPDEINNYLIKIRGKEDNIKFLENNFRDNFTFFGEASAQYQDIKATIDRIYQNKTQNEEAIKLLEKPMQIFINEIMSNEEIRQKFFDEDREMKIKEVKNDKCRMIAYDLKDQVNLKGQIKINNKKNYIAIKDANE